MDRKLINLSAFLVIKCWCPPICRPTGRTNVGFVHFIFYLFGSEHGATTLTQNPYPSLVSSTCVCILSFRFVDWDEQRFRVTNCPSGCWMGVMKGPGSGLAVLRQQRRTQGGEFRNHIKIFFFSDHADHNISVKKMEVRGDKIGVSPPYPPKGQISAFRVWTLTT